MGVGYRNGDLGMKKLLSLTGLVLTLDVGAVNVDFKQFNTNQFSTNGHNISIKGSSSPGGGGIQLSNFSTEVLNLITNSLSDTAIRDGVEIYPIALSNAVSDIPAAAVYLLNCARSNSSNQRLIYQTITATNNVLLLAPTNFTRWDLISLNILSVTSNRYVYFPTLPHLRTNDMTLTDLRGWGYLLMTNHNLVLTIQSNANTMTSIWTED